MKITTKAKLFTAASVVCYVPSKLFDGGAKAIDKAQNKYRSTRDLSINVDIAQMVDKCERCSRHQENLFICADHTPTSLAEQAKWNYAWLHEPYNIFDRKPITFSKLVKPEVVTITQ